MELIGNQFCRESSDGVKNPGGAPVNPECSVKCGKNVFEGNESFERYLQEENGNKKKAAAKLLTKNSSPRDSDWALRRWRLRDGCSIQVDKAGQQAGYTEIRKMLQRVDMDAHRLHVLQSVRIATGNKGMEKRGGLNRANTLILVDEAHSFVAPDPGADVKVREALARTGYF